MRTLYQRLNSDQQHWYWVLKRMFQHPVHYAKYIPKALEEAYYDLTWNKKK